MDAAVPLFKEALESHRATFGADHPGTQGSLKNLVALLQQQGKAAEAEQLLASFR